VAYADHVGKEGLSKRSTKLPIIDVAALARKFANARTCGRPAGLELRRMPLLRPPGRQVDRWSGSYTVPTPGAATAPPYPKEAAKPDNLRDGTK
jgi:hypothetical protein